jgi:hypothetical protein
MALQLLVGILDWLNMQPIKNPSNIVTVIMGFLSTKIPFYWLIFVVCFFAILMRKYYRVKSPGIKNIAGNKYKIIPIEEQLSEDAKWTLLELLHETDCSKYEFHLKEEYIDKLKKGTPDFNILKSEIIRKKLIFTYRATYGEKWYLGEKGKEIAGKIYKSKKEYKK